ncbi:hypothetical protein [Virgibacillus sp. DJP39]|uniref:hypothetical protein n=1 Tax=Virgibacillus sp. DJP39 TaxID=3409790 RepID=UPI003BB50315
MASIEPIGITIIGGIKINALDNTSINAIGENSFQALNSVTKNNIMSGSLYGDFNFNNLQPFGSVIIDPERIDTVVPAVTTTGIGIED